MSDVEVLRCPGCKEYIASDATRCRFCKRPLDAQTVRAAVAATQAENKKYRRDHYLKHMMTGLGLFVLGVVLTVGSLWSAFKSSAGGYYVVTWGLVLAGGGDFVYGMFGVLGEVISRKQGRGARRAGEVRFNGRPES
jgi:uncharacterized membrane-anchored protein